MVWKTSKTPIYGDSSARFTSGKTNSLVRVLMLQDSSDYTFLIEEKVLVFHIGFETLF